jgi:hypothetical protein
MTMPGFSAANSLDHTRENDQRSRRHIRLTDKLEPHFQHAVRPSLRRGGNGFGPVGDQDITCLYRLVCEWDFWSVFSNLPTCHYEKCCFGSGGSKWDCLPL